MDRLAALVLGLALLLPSPAFAAEGSGADTTFRLAHEELVALIDERAPDAQVSARADALLDHHAIAVAALGGASHYAERCAELCDEYEALLSRLIRHNVLARLRAKDRGRMELLGQTVREAATKVDTKVSFVDDQGKARSVKVSYVMHRVDESWRVRDIHTDGVSLVGNYRHELRKLHRDGGIELVVERLRSKVAELDAAP